ncbi:hypothetical protein CSC78_06100 [Pseudoxanthomonas japonensis]|uniref:Uncharacterized protein n=1 Tax=Pseudoxanthomonas japonensis TaxID=69284 RepID=A0ABQ6ZJD4_9GAMM|nr:hypothetical protein CSC78_06100 [Pseudoxanthomonas japonensis]
MFLGGNAGRCRAGDHGGHGLSLFTLHDRPPFAVDDGLRLRCPVRKTEQHGFFTESESIAIHLHLADDVAPVRGGVLDGLYQFELSGIARGAWWIQRAHHAKHAIGGRAFRADHVPAFQDLVAKTGVLRLSGRTCR